MALSGIRNKQCLSPVFVFVVPVVVVVDVKPKEINNYTFLAGFEYNFFSIKGFS